MMARTYLETQGRLWPDLVGTAAVPAADPATIAARANDFERRHRCSRPSWVTSSSKSNTSMDTKTPR